MSVKGWWVGAQKIGPSMFLALERKVVKIERYVSPFFSYKFPEGRFVLHKISCSCSTNLLITGFSPENPLLWINFRVAVKPGIRFESARPE